MDMDSDKSKDLREKELKLLDLARQHIKREEEIITLLRGKKYNSASDLIIENNRLGEEIRNAFSEFPEPPQLRDFRSLKQLQKIRSGNSKTDDLLNVFTQIGYIVYEEIPESELNNKLTETSDEMIEYFGSWAGCSLEFSQRKKDFGTLLVKSPLPENIDMYLSYIKNCYLLNMNEAVVGLCRILLEVACRSIYDKSKGNKIQPSYMDEEREAVQTIIREACKVRKLSPDVAGMAREKYREASNILHGKLPKRVSDEETLDFIRDVFSIIEALY
jgi:hypothetical protein